MSRKDAKAASYSQYTHAKSADGSARPFSFSDLHAKRKAQKFETLNTVQKYNRISKHIAKLRKQLDNAIDNGNQDRIEQLGSMIRDKQAQGALLLSLAQSRILTRKQDAKGRVILKT